MAKKAKKTAKKKTALKKSVAKEARPKTTGVKNVAAILSDNDAPAK